MEQREVALLDSISIQPQAPSHPLIAKLELFATLSAEERAALETLARLKVRSVGLREDIVREGEAPGHVHLILSGWCCRYKQLANGRRQILALLLPGDISDLRTFILAHMDHSIAAITPVTLAELPREALVAMTADGSRLSRALWWSALVAAAIEREWIVSLGQRTAVERLGHLLCELYLRLRAVGLTRGCEYDLPLTQVELAETIGLSTVHVNRTLQELRAQGLIATQGKTLAIPDLARLQRVSLFNDRYLHLGKDERGVDAKPSLANA